MATATSSAPTVRRGFILPCPKCFSSDGVHVNMANVDLFHCNECGEDFEDTDVRAIVEKWGPALVWLKSAPEYQEGE